MSANLLGEELIVIVGHEIQEIVVQYLVLMVVTYGGNCLVNDLLKVFIGKFLTQELDQILLLLLLFSR